MGTSNFFLGEDKLTISVCTQFLAKELTLSISQEAEKKIKDSANRVAAIIENNQTVYGINTGFGPLCNVQISSQETNQLQTKILLSHAVGVGERLQDDLVRLMLLTKLHALCQGFSGIQLHTLKRILYILQNDLLPVVPAKGSVGASGDLAPLAHLFLPLIGEGFLKIGNDTVAAKNYFKEQGIAPIELKAKEGLALINGTQFILAHAIKACIEGQNILEHADYIAAIQVDALQGSLSPFRQELHVLRPFPNTIKVAKRINELLSGSEIPLSHAQCNRVQDPYSLRCVPQVHGASWQAWEHLVYLTEIELNSVTDNPVVLEDGTTISGGNFHGQPLAMALDYFKLALSEIGNIADRRIYLSLEGEKVGLPKLLMKNTGINSGFMIVQYTTAALASENKALCMPNSADSIPTSLGQEDHVSMGSISGRKLLEVLNNVQKILAIELITAYQALEFNRPLKSSAIIEKNLILVRKEIPFLTEDVFMAPYLAAAEKIIANRTLNI